MRSCERYFHRILVSEEHAYETPVRFLDLARKQYLLEPKNVYPEILD